MNAKTAREVAKDANGYNFEKIIKSIEKKIEIAATLGRYSILWPSVGKEYQFDLNGKQSHLKDQVMKYFAERGYEWIWKYKSEENKTFIEELSWEE